MIVKVKGYRVDIKINETGAYVEYTSLKNPVTLEMAYSLARYLHRQDSPGRIVEVTGANGSGRVIDHWEKGQPWEHDQPPKEVSHEV